MIEKLEEKEKAVALRRRGLSYREILTTLPVAKSTLSLWLRSVNLSKSQQQKLTKKKLDAALRGGKARREQRLNDTEKIHELAKRDITHVTRRELLLMGAMLYWAEGSKEKDNHTGSGIRFTNSDALMVRMFIKWLIDVCGIERDSIVIEIYIHEESKNALPTIIEFWSRITKFPKSHFTRIYFKKNKIKTNRKNIDKSYFGLVRVKVKASSKLNRKIIGWIKAICYYSGIV